MTIVEKRRVFAAASDKALAHGFEEDSIRFKPNPANAQGGPTGFSTSQTAEPVPPAQLHRPAGKAGLGGLKAIPTNGSRATPVMWWPNRR